MNAEQLAAVKAAAAAARAAEEERIGQILSAPPGEIAVTELPFRHRTLPVLRRHMAPSTDSRRNAIAALRREGVRLSGLDKWTNEEVVELASMIS